jgi:DNA-binding MarR family transcriptional regulator
MPGGHEIAMALRAAYWAMHRQADAHLAPFGVTANQFVLMSILAEENGLTQQDLVRRASSDANTVRAMLLLLEKRALVSRAPHSTDGRAYCVKLTARGRRTYDRLWIESDPFRARLLLLFSPAQTQALVQQLNSVSQALTSIHIVRPAPATRRAARVAALK